MHTSVVKLTKPNFPRNTRRNWATKTNSHIECIPFVGKAPRKLKEQKCSHSFQCFIDNVSQTSSAEIYSVWQLKFEFTRWQDTISHNRAQSRDKTAQQQTVPEQARQILRHEELPCLWRLRISKKTPHVCKKSEIFMLVCRNSRTSHFTPPHFRPSKQKRHVWARDKFANQTIVVMAISWKGAYYVRCLVDLCAKKTNNPPKNK